MLKIKAGGVVGTSPPSEPPQLRPIWGAEAIGKLIKRSERQTFYLLEQGAIPARKIGGLWCAEENELRRFITGRDEKAEAQEPGEASERTTA